MKTREITICGTQVSVAYCFATEIGFNEFAHVSISKFEPDNPSHIVALICSAITTYYEAKKEEVPIVLNNLMYEAASDELVQAVAAIFELRNEWYKIPSGEPKDTEGSGGDEKNA